jgi:hypothetical protein
MVSLMVIMMIMMKQTTFSNSNNCMRKPLAFSFYESVVSGDRDRSLKPSDLDIDKSERYEERYDEGSD